MPTQISQVFAKDDTAAPIGLYARLCHAFLVCSYVINASLTERI